MRSTVSAIAVMFLTAPNLMAAEAETIDKLIGELASRDFATREAATKQLQNLGSEAAPALAQAALDDELEVQRRAFGILRKLFQSGDDETKKAAQDALQKVAGGKTPGISQQAELLLNPPKPARRQGLGAIQVQVQIGAAGGRKVSVRTVNGVKEIDAEENGQKVQIVDDPQKGIQVKVTQENEEGKEETKEYEARNADDLKKKHPEAHKLYEKYSKGGGINVIQVGVPQRFAVRPFFPARRAADADVKIKEAMETLQEAAQADDPAAEIAKAMKLLEEVREQLKPFRPAARQLNVQKPKAE